MSQEQAVYEVEDVSPVVTGGVNYGKYWGAIRGEQVLAVMPMRVPTDVEFEHYRELSQQVLGVLGEVKSGELFEFEGKRFFVVRLTHANRSKKPRAPKVFEVREFKSQ